MSSATIEPVGQLRRQASRRASWQATRKPLLQPRFHSRESQVAPFHFFAGPNVIASAITTAPQSSSVRHLSFLGFDYGVKRVGVATGNSLTSTATALTTLSSIGDARFAAIARLIAEWRPDALVVGVPYHPDGAAHENTHKAKRFANQLHGRFGLPVHQVDERYSTTEAESLGAHDLDAASAALILEQYLRQLSREQPAS
jgi:putative Holliday junction resolvase